MELKRILAPDVRTALRMVREQLGAEAMIFSNRRVSGGVELIAAAEGSGAAMQAPSEAGTDRAMLAETIAVGAMPPSVAAVAQVPARAAVDVAPGLAEVQSELRSMRDLLEARLTRTDERRARTGSSVQAWLWQRLSRIGLPNRLVREMAGASGVDADAETAWLEALCALAGRIREAGDPVAAGGIFAFVGPAGAGKTTTICKLAVRYALEHGPDAVAMISLDSYRLGATDMLRALARLLGAEFHATGIDEALPDVLARYAARRLILIDTPGLNPRIPTRMTQIEQLGAMRGTIETLLVLPANAQRTSLETAIENYAIASPVACVLTKIDETASLGEVIGAISAASLPVAYSADGQEIPDDIRIARASELVSHAVTLDSGEAAGRGPEDDEFAPEKPIALTASAGRSASESFAAPRGIAARIG